MNIRIEDIRVGDGFRYVRAGHVACGTVYPVLSRTSQRTSVVSSPYTVLDVGGAHWYQGTLDILNLDSTEWEFVPRVPERVRLPEGI